MLRTTYEGTLPMKCVASCDRRSQVRSTMHSVMTRSEARSVAEQWLTSQPGCRNAVSRCPLRRQAVDSLRLLTEDRETIDRQVIRREASTKS